MQESTMKAIIATAYGGPEVLKLTEVARPQPGDQEVLIQVHAASATTADSMMRTGKPYFGRLMTGFSKTQASDPRHWICRRGCGCRHSRDPLPGG
jgi:threonine dehydrogenase-like Zn-dependent dehydrogenase